MPRMEKSRTVSSPGLISFKKREREKKDDIINPLKWAEIEIFGNLVNCIRGLLPAGFGLDCIGSFRCLVVLQFGFCLLLDNILLDNLKCLVSGVCPGLSGTELVEMR